MHARISITLAAAALAVTAGVTTAAAVASPQTTPRPCVVAGHALASGTQVEVDAHGNAWTPGTIGIGPFVFMTCTNGNWTR